MSRAEALPREELREVRGAPAGLIAIVYSPKADSMFGVTSWDRRTERYPQGKRLEVGLEYHEDGINEPVGKGNLDPWSLGPCARTHIPSAVTVTGTGQGLATYTALATLAFQRFGRPCIASVQFDADTGRRSKAADAWWARALKGKPGRYEPLAQKLPGPGAAGIALETLITRGLVVWMAAPGDYEGLVLEAAASHLEAFAQADPGTTFPAPLDVIRQTLVAGGLGGAELRQWADAYLPSARSMRPNRRRTRKPAFVTPELEAQVAALYADLEGL